MKTSIIYLIAISFLFQSCYTYKAINLKETPLVTGKNYKIKTEQSEKVKLLSVNDSTIIVSDDNSQRTFEISQIKEIKEGKFSVLKTIGLVTTLGLVAIVTIGTIAMSDFTMGNFTFPAQ